MARPEQILQRAVIGHLKARPVPGLVWFHVAQSNYGRNAKGIAIQASINKGLGVRAGVSDLILLHDGKFFALELKAEGGRPTDAQLEFIADVNNAGGFATWCEGVDRAVRVLECWGLLRGAAQVSRETSISLQ